VAVRERVAVMCSLAGGMVPHGSVGVGGPCSYKEVLGGPGQPLLAWWGPAVARGKGVGREAPPGGDYRGRSEPHLAGGVTPGGYIPGGLRRGLRRWCVSAPLSPGSNPAFSPTWCRRAGGLRLEIVAVSGGCASHFENLEAFRPCRLGQAAVERDQTGPLWRCACPH
jgi:hypothetical protein